MKSSICGKKTNVNHQRRKNPEGPIVPPGSKAYFQAAGAASGVVVGRVLGAVGSGSTMAGVSSFWA